MPKEYSVGDEVWWAKCGTNRVALECPVCFGRKLVTLILGNNEHIVTPCAFCGAGYSAPTGYVTEYRWIAEYKKITIDGVSIDESNGKREILYKYCDYRIHPDDIFDTEEGAKIRCEQKIAEQAESEQKRLKSSKEYNYKTYSWHVGYHRREAKEAARKLAYHEARAIACKTKSKNPIDNLGSV